MAVTSEIEPITARRSKGLRSGALGATGSVILATASAAPAYSLAATIAFVVVLVGVQAPAVVVLAFVPILFISMGYSALNRRDPDCGTIFTWGSKLLGPRIGFMAGWAIIASFVIVMGSLAQVAGQYGFLLIGADSIGSDASSPWVLLVGLAWIGLMSWVCYRGIEVAALVQRVLLSLEFTMLALFSVIALVRVYTDQPAAGSAHPQLSWLNPFEISSPGAFASALVLMLFIYWGWETSLTVSEETTDSARTPGRAGIISTVLLLALYLVATTATIAFAGTATTGIGLGNPENSGDVFFSLSGAVFGSSAFGTFCAHLMLLMVLSSAAASTETTILTLGRTTLAMGDRRAIPAAFAQVHPVYASPKTSTIATGVAGALVYIVMNFLSDGNVIVDAVSSCGLLIAFYYGLTGLTAALQYRRTPVSERTGAVTQAILPAIGGLILLTAGGWSLKNAWNPDAGYTSWSMPFAPHWHIGGVFIIGVGAFLVGLVVMLVFQRRQPEFFAGAPREDFNARTVPS